SRPAAASRRRSGAWKSSWQSSLLFLGDGMPANYRRACVNDLMTKLHGRKKKGRERSRPFRGGPKDRPDKAMRSAAGGDQQVLVVVHRARGGARRGDRRGKRDEGEVRRAVDR